jgi:hypothetical protein
MCCNLSAMSALANWTPRVHRIRIRRSCSRGSPQSDFPGVSDLPKGVFAASSAISLTSLSKCALVSPKAPTHTGSGPPMTNCCSAASNGSKRPSCANYGLMRSGASRVSMSNAFWRYSDAIRRAR